LPWSSHVVDGGAGGAGSAVLPLAVDMHAIADVGGGYEGCLGFSVFMTLMPVCASVSWMACSYSRAGVSILCAAVSHATGGCHWRTPP
jgi:hypothetical protein